MSAQLHTSGIASMCVGPGDLNTGPCALGPGPLPTELSLQPQTDFSQVCVWGGWGGVTPGELARTVSLL